jgi:hypothetical protein
MLVQWRYVVLAAVTGAVAGCSSEDCDGWVCAADDAPIASAVEQCLQLERPHASPVDAGVPPRRPDGDERRVHISVGDRIEVTADMFGFRCSQEACARVLREEATIKVVFQPCDLHPMAVPRCSCPQQLRVSIAAAPGEYTVEVYHRSDEHAGPSEPLLIATERVEVR